MTLQVRKILAALFAAVLCWGSFGVTAREVPIKAAAIGQSGPFLVGRFTSALDDRSSRFDVGHASSAAMADRYVPVLEERSNFGYTRGARWLRFSIDPDGGAARLLLEVAMPSLDQVDLYIPLRGGGYEVLHAGDQLPWSARPVAHRNHVFPLDLRAGIAVTY